MRCATAATPSRWRSATAPTTSTCCARRMSAWRSLGRKEGKRYSPPTLPSASSDTSRGCCCCTGTPATRACATVVLKVVGLQHVAPSSSRAAHLGRWTVSRVLPQRPPHQPLPCHLMPPHATSCATERGLPTAAAQVLRRAVQLPQERPLRATPFYFVAVYTGSTRRAPAPPLFPHRPPTPPHTAPTPPPHRPTPPPHRPTPPWSGEGNQSSTQRPGSSRCDDTSPGPPSLAALDLSHPPRSPACSRLASAPPRLATPRHASPRHALTTR